MTTEGSQSNPIRANLDDSGERIAIPSESAVFSKHASTYHWQEMEADMPEGDACEDL